MGESGGGGREEKKKGTHRGGPGGILGLGTGEKKKKKGEKEGEIGSRILQSSTSHIHKRKPSIRALFGTELREKKEGRKKGEPIDLCDLPS